MKITKLQGSSFWLAVDRKRGGQCVDSNRLGLLRVNDAWEKCKKIVPKMVIFYVFHGDLNHITLRKKSRMKQIKEHGVYSTELADSGSIRGC